MISLIERTGVILSVAAFALMIGGSGQLAAQTQAQSESAIEAAPSSEAEPEPLIPQENAVFAEELTRQIAAARGQAQKKRLAGIEANYALNDFNPIWTDRQGAIGRARDMVDILRAAGDDGLRPGDYGPQALSEMLSASDEAQLASLEIKLSVAAVTFAQHMNAGRLDPRSVNREIVIYPDAISAEAVMGNLRNTTNQRAYFRLLAPHTPRYERLRSALAVYRRIAEQGGWTPIPEGEVIKPGESDPRVAAIRQRMREAGTYSGPEPVDETALSVYDTALEEAVKQFQKRTNQTTDGVIGPATITAMNIKVEDRISTMVVNMERNRWMQNDFGRYHILANLADQVVKVVRDGDTIHAEVIQVGKPYHRTPVFTDEMEYIEINPYWNVPVSIAVNEYLPKLRRNPGVLAAENIDLLSGGSKINARAVSWASYGRGNFPFRLRQRPGPGNALGRIKFMFPNQFNVYLHDTPSKSKFNATQRYFSHGCLRLRNPLDMAEVLLGSQGWSRERIDSVVASGKRTVVKLDETIPVHVVYITSFVNKDGSVHFREDVYGRDEILANALNAVGG